MKQIYSKLFALFVCLALWLPCGAFTVDGLNYSVSDGQATVTGATSKAITSVSIPATVTYGDKTYPVNVVKYNAFHNYTSLRSVRFEDSEEAIVTDASMTNGNSLYVSPFQGCPVEEYYFGREPAQFSGNDGSVYANYIYLASTSESVSLTFAGETKRLLSASLLFKNFDPLKVKTITLGGDINLSGSNTFKDCTNLETLNLLAGTYDLRKDLFPSTYIIDTLNLLSPEVPKFYIEARNVVFSEGWETIPVEYLSNRTGLETITLPNTLITIEREAFKGNGKLTTVQFPSSLKTIGQSAFSSCEKLDNFSLNQGLEKIEDSAFHSSFGPKLLIVPNSVKTIGYAAFYNNSNIEEIVIEASESNDPLESGSMAWAVGNFDKFVINRTLKLSGDRFDGECNPKHVVFGEGWQSIPKHIFIYNREIETVSFPETLVSIEGEAFRDCENLKTINFPSSLRKIAGGAFNNCPKLVIPPFNDGLEIIELSAFVYCYGADQIILPGSLKDVGANAFRDLEYVNDIILLPSNDKSALKCEHSTFGVGEFDNFILDRKIEGPNILWGCKPKNIAFGECWETVPDYSVYHELYSICESLSLPNCQSIADNAFSKAENLKSIECAAKVPPVCGNNVFAESIYPTAVLTVPSGTKRYYASAEVWKNFLHIQTDNPIKVTVHYDEEMGMVRINNMYTDYVELDEGQMVSVAFLPKTGYEVVALTVNGKDAIDQLDGSFLMYKEVEESLDIVVEFAPIMFTLSVNSDISGYVEINGSQDHPDLIQYGERVVIHPVPLTGYEFNSLMVNGKSVKLNPEGNYVIESLEENLNVTAYFEPIRLFVGARYDMEMGKVSLNGEPIELMLDYGSELVIKIEPAEGHYLSQVDVNGDDMTAKVKDGTLVLDKVTEELHVTVTFEVYKYEVTSSYDADKGAVFINGEESVTEIAWGEKAVIRVVPEYGYRVASVVINGEDMTTNANENGEYVIDSVTEDLLIKVEFEDKRVRLSILGLEGGSISTVLDFGTEMTLYPVAETGWTFHSATVGAEVIKELDLDGGFNVGPLTEDTEVSVVFVRTTGVNNVSSADNLTVTAKNRQVIISGAPDEAVAEVFNAAGTCLYSGRERVISFDNGGVYIVTIAGKSFKLMLR